jgi:transposase
MHLQRRTRNKDGRKYEYWELVESYRTQRGPRRRSVAYLGVAGPGERLGVKLAAQDEAGNTQGSIFDDDVEPQWVEVDTKRVRVERTRQFGGAWLGLELMKMLGLPEFLRDIMPLGLEDIPWWAMSLILVLCRLCDASSELRIAEHLYERSALPDLLGVPIEKVNDDRLYRSLDKLLIHKPELEIYLANRLGELFGLQYDLLLYDVTSTYFEGECKSNDQARRGYSRDHRGDCKQVTIALVVSRCGMPLGYEVFEGSRHDSTTVEYIVEMIESRYGRADRIWVMDRGMTSEENIAYLREGGRRYILGTPKSELRKFERQLVDGNWTDIHEGLEVKLCPSADGEETFILCRSAKRREKENAMHERFERRISDGLTKMEQTCTKKRYRPTMMAQRVGRLLEKNSRAAGLFNVDVQTDERGAAKLVWSKVDAWRDWASLSEGCYILRSNVNDWSAEDLWKAYIQLTEAESAFRIHKSDLNLRPIWHQKKERVHAHILVCFLAYVIWKTLARSCSASGLGDEPRKVFDEIAQIQMVDVVLPTKSGIDIRRRCVARPTKHQAILLQHLRLSLPTNLKLAENVAQTSTTQTATLRSKSALLPG